MDAVSFVVAFVLLLYVGGILATVLVARSRGRSPWYVLWPVLFGKIGAIIAIAVILVQPEKVEKEARTEIRTPRTAPPRRFSADGRTRQVRLYQQWSDHKRACDVCADRTPRCPRGDSLHRTYTDAGGRLP